MDVFALGSIFYERCYFDKPYPNPNDNSPLAFDPETERPLPIRGDLEKPLPEGLKQLIHEMLRHSPEERPKADEILSRLEAIF